MADLSTTTSFSTMAEQVIYLLSKGLPNNDTPYRAPTVIRWLRQAANKIMGGMIGQAWANGERVVDAKYIATFNNVAVLVDSDTGENYCDLPVFGYISLPMNAEIQRVVPKLSTGYGKAMIPINNSEMDIYGPLEAGYLEGQWFYFPERHKIVFGKKNNKTLKENSINSVQVKLVTLDPASVGDDDPLPISSDLHDLIIKEVLATYGAVEEIEADQLTNANPNKK